MRAMQLFLGLHGGRIFSGRMRRGAAEADITYESMLALDENNARRAVKAQVLDSLQRVGTLVSHTTQLIVRLCLQNLMLKGCSCTSAVSLGALGQCSQTWRLQRWGCSQLSRN